MKKLLVLILSILFLSTVNIKASSDSWYTPDLEEYTFKIPAESEDFIFRRHDFATGSFTGFINRQYDFGVSQNSEGALDFTNIQQTLLWVGQQSVSVSGGGGGGGSGIVRSGLLPMINNLPSYVSYNIYNTYDRTAYKGAVDVHVITYRIDFLGNYSMLLKEYKYDIVYSLEVKYELMIDYFDLIDTALIKRGYTIHWYDTSEMKENKLYTSMNSNLLQFDLMQISGGSEGFEMNDMHILLITLIMYILSIIIYFKFNLKWVLIATILLWFVPIFLVDIIFVKIFCVIMIIATITITFFSEREEYIE